MIKVKTYKGVFGSITRKLEEKDLLKNGWKVIKTHEYKKRNWVLTIFWLFLFFPIAFICVDDVSEVHYEKDETR